MCLGIPGRVVELLDGFAGHLALVDVQGGSRRVNIGMLDAPPEPGAWVLIHLGFAVEVIDAAGAARALAGLELIGRGRRQRRRYTVSGLVQGVGFRPFAYATAAALALTGSVANTADGVVIEVEGDPDDVAEYGRRLRAQAPPLAMIVAVAQEELPSTGGTGFTIEPSRGGPARTLASPDVATCADCLHELGDPADRRHRHPFINCTNCGPRFTIITGLPYDRDATTMASFPMCPACRAEYEDPADRRFHAQPIACPACGPRLTLVDAAGAPVSPGEDPVTAARRLLASGRIVAVKGLGGYHLACDARDPAATGELRRRKQRGGKPFAVMVADLGTARRLAELSAGDEELLGGARRPIVLAPRRAGSGLAAEVAPGNPDLGLMLPYTALHALLLGLPGDPPGPDALVMTSGNRSGEPIVTDDGEALRRLAPLADAWLRHDRPIRVPCDDSVSRHVDGAELPVRRSRGYAPLPVALPFPVAPTLAAGADLKSACAVASGRYAWLSQHIGDMDDLATINALTVTERHLEELTGVRPELLVADLHPGYRSSEWALRNADGRPVRRVQHHHAHVASVMAEHGLGAGERVIGVAFDGTGFGPDGAAWGGEVLVAGYRTYRRAARLGYVPLAGGDASVLRPYRMALAHLHAAGLPWHSWLPPVAACPRAERDLLARQFATGAGCVPTSSMGRLFDAVSSLIGVRHAVEYEAEAAIVLEGVARAAPAGPGRAYRFEVSVSPDGSDVADPGPVVRDLATDLRAGVPAPVLAAGFHAAVAGLIADLADRCRERTGLDVVALGGGVFQNALLISGASRLLRERGFTVLRPRLLPPNDGGIALGQLVIGASGGSWNPAEED
ncbi:carbamoyltransferase HypF [Actinoplanes regularis]|uniref:Carbamoyltransferase n=1 Tax=Actinoplanes regularis TaxID=52697 RepID=A0A239F7H7_9ACTN|nr:carbamoyltransferase HypF [Actinoplanes regularis]GIE90022.1 carbamoyltransferase [Actinoplanes regularis]SNS52990.1 hydrogenase maturation protein HypF [Actinoplanes regularis]